MAAEKTVLEELREHAAATGYDDVRELMRRAATEIAQQRAALKALRLRLERIAQRLDELLALVGDVAALELADKEDTGD